MPFTMAESIVVPRTVAVTTTMARTTALTVSPAIMLTPRNAITITSMIPNVGTTSVATASSYNIWYENQSVHNHDQYHYFSCVEFDVRLDYD